MGGRGIYFVCWLVELLFILIMEYLKCKKSKTIFGVLFRNLYWLGFCNRFLIYCSFQPDPNCQNACILSTSVTRTALTLNRRNRRQLISVSEPADH